MEEAVTFKGDGPGASTYLREFSYYQDHDCESRKLVCDLRLSRSLAIAAGGRGGFTRRSARYFHHYLELGDAKAEEEALQLWKRHCRDEAEARAAGETAWLFAYRGGRQ